MGIPFFSLSLDDSLFLGVLACRMTQSLCCCIRGTPGLVSGLVMHVVNADSATFIGVWAVRFHV
ncbi:MAG TPA: hypothetical protein GXX56_05220 [Rhodocyclaceae bacterium]|nr:hypothetical protein [Rhodocyclaceae bacterium]